MDRMEELKTLVWGLPVHERYEGPAEVDNLFTRHL